MITVLIADDDIRIRDDFSALLGLEPDLRVVGAVADGEAAVESGERLSPDVIVMDVRMPRVDGIEATRRIAARPSPRPAVLVVTTFDLDEYVFGAFRAGAAGFLVKDSAPQSLADAVRVVASGEGMVSPRATARLIREFSSARVDVVHPLTERELEVVRLMARGLSNEELAAAASISRATVKTHVSSILAKLGLTSRIQIVVWAYDHGIAELGPRS